jgi:tRNA (guanine-N7-)-methyltransferase
MPHLFIKKPKELLYPFKKDKVEFLFKVGDLIACKVEDRKFFISLQQRGDKYLLKYDKITRPLSSQLKQAYLTFIEATNVEVITSNIDGIKDRTKSRFLLSLEENLNFENQEIIVEIGFGSGRHLLHLAKKYKDKIIIGIEIHKPSIEQVLKRVELEGIENIRVIDYDGRLVLSKIESNKVHSIYVHFPVPWDKKPHRRVISNYFINESIRVLKQGGFLHLRTDSDNYFDYSFKEFMKLNKNELKIYKNRELEISSKYEDRWKRLKKNIYDIFMMNETLSPNLEEEFDFNLGALDASKAKKKAYLFEQFVIHFERVLPIDSDKSLIKLTMGAFERPEHLYIVASKSGDSYYFNRVIEHKLNQEAHNKLKEILSCQK